MISIQKLFLSVIPYDYAKASSHYRPLPCPSKPWRSRKVGSLLNKIRILFFSLFLTSNILAENMPTFSFKRIACPSSVLVEQMRAESQQRTVKKYVMTVGVIAGSMIVLYMAYKVHEQAVCQEAEQALKAQQQFLLHQERERMKAFLQEYQLIPIQKIPEGVIIDQKISYPSLNIAKNKPGFFTKISDSVKSFCWGSSKFLADSLLLVVSGSVVNGFMDFVQTKWSATYVDETVLWFVHNQTTLPIIFQDLKAYSVDYDLHATLLCNQAFSQDVATHVKAFLRDISNGIDGRNSIEMAQSGYYSFLFDEVKKKYQKKSSQFEQRQDFVDIACSHQKRADDDVFVLQFVQDTSRRQEIAQMCTMLVSEMDKVLAFIAMHGQDSCSTQIYDIVDSCNLFLAHMEMLLGSSLQELQTLSKQDQGMFTTIYEFERTLMEKITFLHRYCRLQV